MSNWLDIVKSVAPTVATALGGPLAGLAVQALGTAMGVDQPTVEKVKDALTQGQMTGDQIVALKQAEQNLLIKMRELDITEEQLSASDRDSARTREEKVGDSTNRNLAYIIIASFIVLVGGVLFGNVRVESALAGTLVGYISAKCEQVLAYYFGSSKAHEQAVTALQQSVPKN